MRRLMDGLENLLERHDRYNRGDNFFVATTTHHRGGDRQTHFLTGTNDLGPADDQATTAHSRQNIRNPLVYLVTLYDVRLKGTAQLAAYRPNRQRNQIRIVLK